MTDKYIIDTLYNNGKLKPCWKKLVTEEIKEYLQNKYVDSESIEESIYRLYNNISIRPVCKYCGNKVKFKCNHFENFCTRSCSAKSCQAKREQTMLEHYGTKTQFGRSEVRQNIVKTINEKYGVDNVFALKEIREKSNNTKLERYGDKNYHNVEKFHKTCQEKYGCNAPAQNKEIRTKQIKTSFERYGGYWNKQQVSKTIKERYNVDWYTLTEDLKNKTNTLETRNKQYLTKKKNNSFNTSKPEELCYNLLIDKFNHVIRQYSSELYPFNCDFYIPSLDMYIEYQGSWTHGFKPFDENCENDILQWEALNNSNSQYKKNVAYNWRYRDVKKRNIAKQNNINYLEFFNINDFIEWYNNLS